MIYDLLKKFNFNTNIEYELIIEKTNKRVYLLNVDGLYYILNIYSNKLLAEKDLLIFKNNHYLDNDYIPSIVKNNKGEKITNCIDYYGAITTYIKNDLHYKDKVKNTKLILEEYFKFRETLNINNLEISKEYLTDYSMDSIINKCLFKFKDYDNYKSIERVFKYIKEELTKYKSEEKNTKEIIHGDLHRGNIILNNNRMYIIDFEDIGVGSIFFDIATLLLETDIIDSDIANEILKDYFKHDNTNIELNLKINIVLVNLMIMYRKNYNNSTDKLWIDLKKIKEML